MDFRTIIPVSNSKTPLDYNAKIVSLGSCFAVNMANKFDYLRFENSCNPFGIIFNPFSIEKLINRVVNQAFYTEEDVFFYNERWHCFEVHSELSNADKSTLLSNLNAIVLATKLILEQASHIIITYGTSWVYRNVESKKIVASCHKVPQNRFSKEILPIETIEKSIQNTIDLIQKINSNAKFIFTVSPVRHLKDGFIENQLSKAHLISAIHKVVQVLNSGAKGDYFPSYEIMMDELRDYRFYDADMIHPNEVAIDYIWERFSQSFITIESRPIMKVVEAIQKGLSHRPFNASSVSHQAFLHLLQQKIQKIQDKYPHIIF
jgi:hypothetical protein